MNMDVRYYVYIMTDKRNKSLHTGISRNLKKKLDEQNSSFFSRFIKRTPAKLVYYEVFYDPYYAAVRNKKIKSVSRLRKIELIQCMNREWRDLYDDLE
jgi:putative endonuclease